MFLLDIQVSFDNCSYLPITHTAADVALFAQRLAMFIHICLLTIHLLRKISKLTLKCVTKTFILFLPVIPIEKVSQNALRKQQLGADLAYTFIERCLLTNRVIQFHASFPSRTE